MDTTSNQPDPPPDIAIRAALRVAQPDNDAWADAAARAGWCTRPVRLIGTLDRVDRGTGEVVSSFDSDGQPDRVLLKACRSRRANRCPACAAIYRSDARALILAGLVGGKGVPDAVEDRPVVFVTLTAPSFGPVHTSHPDDLPCHPRWSAGPAGHLHRCLVVHDHDAPVVGAPLCASCYDWDGAVVWNARANELWRRSMIATGRSLAGRIGMTVRAAAGRHPLAYVKIIEYQARGLVHVHALVRLDDAALEAGCHADALTAALHAAAGRASAPNPIDPARPIRWGTRSYIIALPSGDRTRLAGYLAKYTTKSVDAGGILDRPLRSGDLTGLPVEGHLARMAQSAWDLAEDPRVEDLHLRGGCIPWATGAPWHLPRPGLRPGGQRRSPLGEAWPKVGCSQACAGGRSRQLGQRAANSRRWRTLTLGIQLFASRRQSLLVTY